MRYDKRADLYLKQGERYDPETGKNVANFILVKANIPCTHMPMSIEKVSATFGEVERDINTVHFDRKVDRFTHLQVKGIKYKVRKLVSQNRSVAYVEEVSEWI